MDYSASKAFILDKLERNLPTDLYYHGLHHTRDVLATTQVLCEEEKIDAHNTILLKTAALYHDAGFLRHHFNHEVLGCEIVREYLPEFGYTKTDIEKICGMIMSTKIPQSPKNNLEKILCDADLDYLGRSDFKLIGDTLYKELKAYEVIDTEERWNRMQVHFLEKHRFFTKTNQQKRRSGKLAHLAALRQVVAAYDDMV